MVVASLRLLRRGLLTKETAAGLPVLLDCLRTDGSGSVQIASHCDPALAAPWAYFGVLVAYLARAIRNSSRTGSSCLDRIAAQGISDVAVGILVLCRKSCVAERNEPSLRHPLRHSRFIL